MESADTLIKCVETYFGAADRCDPAGAMATMTPDCVMEYLTDNRRYVGRDTGIKKYLEERAGIVKKSWHGDFVHAADPARNMIATRFKVRRTDAGQPERHGDNLNLFQFEGRLIKRIWVWRSPGMQPA
jgi:hypothetical protein